MGLSFYYVALLPVIPYLCCSKEGLTARGHPNVGTRLRVYDLSKDLWTKLQM